MIGHELEQTGLRTVVEPAGKVPDLDGFDAARTIAAGRPCGVVKLRGPGEAATGNFARRQDVRSPCGGTRRSRVKIEEETIHKIG